MASAKKSWTGDAEMQGLFEELCRRETTHAKDVFSAKLKALVNIAFKYQNEFKMVVYEVESFVKKTAIQNKIFGLYIIDSICKKSRGLNPKEKDMYSNRFALRLKETIGFCDKISSKEKITLRKIVDEWGKQDIFPRELLQTLKIEDKKSIKPTFAQSPDDSSDGGEGGEVGAFESIMSRAKPPATPPLQPPLLPPPKPPASKAEPSSAAVAPMDPRRRGAVAANSAPLVSFPSSTPSSAAAAFPPAVAAIPAVAADVIATTQPPPVTTTQKPILVRPIKEVKKAVRLCPFREGNCPFSEKCRFSHYETNTLESYAVSRQTSKPSSSASSSSLSSSSTVAAVRDGQSSLKRFTQLDLVNAADSQPLQFDSRYHHSIEEWIPEFKRVRATEIDPAQNFSFKNAGKVYIVSKIQFDLLL